MKYWEEWNWPKKVLVGMWKTKNMIILDSIHIHPISFQSKQNIIFFMLNEYLHFVILPISFFNVKHIISSMHRIQN